MFDGNERERQEALGQAVGALHRRERTVAEMHEWLTGRGVSDPVIDDVLSELIELGELDDDRFAFAFAADKRELSGWGSERIEAALVDRGLERTLAQNAGREDRGEQVERAVAQLLRRGQALVGDEDRSRALAFLTRRGYEYELAYDAIRRAASSDEASA